ncbi:SDR family NAD(P)-dependent oxidoreductase [Paenalcaligenes niemegkensis]|uniref:SDR family NAD(P)-dependent oxidoreductase n=1 Tax=Paenalcaligenes niemegkensis TaxID=2895469 RepID=UPI001EE8C8DC|nr:SDR family NAD(P)-dependent oxidoreductase [Paenalcaligenes niemegkensis]MCQ9618150.1 SDR family NAD(P)-dependent oxidoreductase [Paenalcaligenes niemegkensis]
MTMTTRRVALISGAGRGIGFAIAAELLKAGWAVSVGSRTAPAGLGAVGSETLHWSAYDARDAASETAWVDAAVAYFGRIDALVHNAGILSETPVIEASEAEVDDLLQVNVKSPLRITQRAWPHLKNSDRAKVVVLASLSGKRVRAPQSSLYSLSKAAVLNLTHGIRHCGEADGIRATAICPGFVATDMAAKCDEEIMDQLTRPEDVAVIVRTVLELPNTASVAEVPINWRVESEY